MEKLIAAAGTGIYCIEPGKVILATQRKTRIDALAYHQGKLYDGGQYADSPHSIEIYDTRTGTQHTKIKAADNIMIHVGGSLSLIGITPSQEGLYAAVEDNIGHGHAVKLPEEVSSSTEINVKAQIDYGLYKKGIYQTPGRASAISTYNGVPCIASRVSRLSSIIETIHNQELYAGWPVHAMASTSYDTYVAYSSFGAGSIAKIDYRKHLSLVAERKCFVNALALCDGILFDATQSEYHKSRTFIFQTRLDRNQEKEPIAIVPEYVKAMINVPEELWNQLANHGQEIKQR